MALIFEEDLKYVLSKFFFWVEDVEYLGHIVSHEGVKVEPKKIKSIKKWKVPTTINHCEDFSG